MTDDISKLYEKETRKPCNIQEMFIPDAAVMPTWDYVRWLEKKLASICDQCECNIFHTERCHCCNDE